MKEKISGLRSRSEAALRRACGQIDPRRRAMLVIALCVVFTIINLWIVISAFCGQSQKLPPAQNIEAPEVPAQGSTSLLDKILEDHEREQSEK